MGFPAAPPHGWIRVVCRPGSSAGVLGGYENTIELSVLVDGAARTSAWGESILPVFAGDHHVFARLTAITPMIGTGAGGVVTTQFGDAGIVVRVAAGQTVTVFYAAPNSPRTPGAFSFTPLPPAPVNGMKIAQVVMAPILGFIMLAVAVVALFIILSLSR